MIQQSQIVYERVEEANEMLKEREVVDDLRNLSNQTGVATGYSKGEIERLIVPR